MGDLVGMPRKGHPARPRKLVTIDGNEDQFDLTPVAIGEFSLRARSVVAIGKPTLEGWANALRFASAAHESSPYWVGGLVAYAENRADWREKLDQAKSVTGLAEQTLHNLGYIYRHVEEPERQLAPSLSHAAEVAPLERVEQTEWLTKARDEGWSAREMRQEIRAARRTKVIDGQAELKGLYRIIYADCPWKYSDSGATKNGSLGKAERHYTGMTIEELMKLPVKAHALPDSILFAWVTTPFVLLNPGPREVVEEWGFTYKSLLTWDKVLGMPGHYGLDVTTEHLIIATRGSCLPDVPTPLAKSLYVERRSNTHSEKPEGVRHWIEKHWTRGPYLELFGRKRVDGWSVLGNDARLWATERAREVQHA